MRQCLYFLILNDNVTRNYGIIAINCQKKKKLYIAHLFQAGHNSKIIVFQLRTACDGNEKVVFISINDISQRLQL